MQWGRNASDLNAFQIAGTIASVRRDRLGEDDEDDEAVFRRKTMSRLLYICSNSNMIVESSEPSFIAERSFVDAPLNSRVPIQFTTAKKKGKQKAEPLDRLPLDVQEALILEDLLFVLMVRFSFVL